MAHKRSFLVDGNNCAFRFDSALNLDWQGQRVGAIYGFMTALRQWRLSTRYAKVNIVVFWDQGHAKERVELLPTYKQREERSEEEQGRMEQFYSQTNLLRSLLPMMGCSCVYGPGMECDDLLATWADTLASTDPECYIRVLSGDSDFHQLVNDRVTIITPDSAVLGPEQVVEKTGVLPALVANMKALTGDSSDKIPGIPGVGPKRALALLCDYPSLTNMNKVEFAKEVAELSTNTKKYAEAVLANWRVYTRNYMLIKLPSDLVTINRKEVVRIQPKLDKVEVKKTFINFGFASLLTKFTELWDLIEDAA